ncbi:hypothetical protein [Sinomicrobium sp. M5D2P9]
MEQQQLRLLLQKLQEDTLTRDELGALKTILDCHGSEDKFVKILEEYWEKEKSGESEDDNDRCIFLGKYFYIIYLN